MKKKSVSRRLFVAGAGAIAGSAAISASAAPIAPPTAESAATLANLGAAPAGVNQAPAGAGAPQVSADTAAGLQFLTYKQAQIVDAITSRIFPTTDTPGADEADVVVFIDRQLSGYMSKPSNLYASDQRPFVREGLAAIDRIAQTRTQKGFADLTPAEQDRILMDVEDATAEAKAAFGNINPNAFFTLMRNLTIQGMFADPVYGGNKGMVGWRLINFPGAQLFYSADEFVNGPRNKTFLDIAAHTQAHR